MPRSPFIKYLKIINEYPKRNYLFLVSEMIRTNVYLLFEKLAKRIRCRKGEVIGDFSNGFLGFSDEGFGFVNQ